MTYNSRTWNKSITTDPNNPNLTVDHFTYDVEQSWIAPGFSTGFGYLSSNLVTRNVVMMNGSNTQVKVLTEIIPEGIVDADGTRHQIAIKSSAQIPNGHSSASYPTAFGTTDGSLADVKRSGSFYSIGGTVDYTSTSFTVAHPNGLLISYSSAFGTGNSRRHYPIKIRDRNGNLIHISYKGQTGRIDYITDTLNRKIKFYYENDSNGNPDKLVTVTIPGMEINSEIQTVRFYYENLSLNPNFAGQISSPPSIRVLRYIYMPGTETGYKYDYNSNYGMIQTISRMVGMEVDSDSFTQTGTVTPNSGLVAASTAYNYQDGTNLNDVPKYTKRTDDWAGRPVNMDAQETFYDYPEPDNPGEMVSTISVPDNGFFTVTKSISAASGLLKEVSLSKVPVTNTTFSTLLSRTKYVTWSGNNPTKIETTNDSGLTQSTEFEYDQYNNQTKIKEYDYKSGTNETLLRTTELEYVTGSGWIAAKLFSLVKSVKVIVGGQIVSKTLYEYDHDGIDLLTRRDDISVYTHDIRYNPSQQTTCTKTCLIDPINRSCDGSLAPEEEPETPEEEPLSDPEGCVIKYNYGYDPNSVYRGNVTRVARMLDVNATTVTDTNSNKNNYSYDIAGNLVSASLSCCNVKMINYGSSYAETGYAFPVSETKGSSPQLTTSATYNYNTGLPLTSTNENGQVTQFQYEADTLRQKKVIYPNGGFTETEYSDKLVSGANLLPGFVRTTTTLEANKTVQSYSYYDGRGLGIRSASETPDGWSISAVEHDKIGRAVKSYNPFYGTTPTVGIAPNTKYMEVLNYDALGRTTTVKMQDDTTVSTEFGDNNSTPSTLKRTFVTITDQAGKKRRQLADALGRITRVDEPDANGNLGGISTPNQPTVYEYDANDNLAKVTQTDGAVVQERFFKYDGLSRLTHERQVEANATLDDNGVKQTSGGVWTKVLKYNLDGLLQEGTDARGVKTTFLYDGLNRVKTVAYSDGTPKVEYTYDQARTGFFNNGALTRVETKLEENTPQGTPTTATEFDYDQMGRVTKHRQAIGTQVYPMEYGYNLAGQLTSEKYPSGKTITVNYDTKGRLANIADQSRTYLSGLQFQGKANSLSQMTFGNGTIQSFEMNDRLQMTKQELKRGAETLQKYDYGYGQIDGNGNLDITKNNGQLAKIESHIGAAKQWTQKFSYDSLGRLSESKEYRGDTNALSYKQKFDYDKFGNLYRKNASNPVTGQENPLPFVPIEAADINKANNRFATQTTYDDTGNVIVDSKFRTSSFFYDANGRMIKATRDNVPDATSIYDSAGMRVAEKVNDVWRFLIYDAYGKLVAEYGGLQATDEGGVKYLFSDWQGSTRAIISQGGYVQGRMDYTAFGEDVSAGTGIRTTAQGFNSNNNLRQKYGLTERDEATGLDHTWFRKNEQKAGRWTSPDPYNGSMSLDNPQSFNRYAYVENQPTNFTDPTGLQIESVCRMVRYAAITIRNDETGEIESYTPGGWNLECITIFSSGGGLSPIGTRDPEEVQIGGGGTPLAGIQQADPNGDECRQLQKKINDIATGIASSKSELAINPLKLPDQPPYPGAPDRLSQQGHRDLINKYENNLKNAEDRYRKRCGGDPPPGGIGPVPVPVRIPGIAPKNLPVPGTVPLPRLVTPSLPILIIPRQVIEETIRQWNEDLGNTVIG